MLDVRLGSPQQHQHLIIYPLLSPTERELPYLLLIEAISTSLVEITEKGGGSVPTLIARNKSADAVLVLDGEQLIGARQNRMTNRSILLPGNSETEIPVFCMEHGRWQHRSSTMSTKPYMSPSKVRRHARTAEADHSERGEMASPMYLAMKQSDVWSEISEVSDKLGVHSSTGALDHAYDVQQSSIDTWLPHFEAVPAQVGVLAFAAGQPLGLDVIGGRALYARVHQRLLYGYVMDAQLQFADGSLSDVRSVSVTVRDQNASGLELKAAETPRGVTAPVAFVNYVAGVQDVSITLDAPIGTEVLLHAFDDGGFFESNGTHSVFAITAPANTQAVRVAFRMSDGKEIGPFRYVLKSVEAAVSATTTSALAAILAEAVVCTRVTFDWPPPANLDFGARQGYKKLGIDLMNAGLAKLARAPTVACRADRINGMQYWGTVKELQFGMSPGQLTVQIKPSPGWLATLPATATGAYVKAVFLDGKSSREVRLRINELNARQ